jgi:hypothetical protein
MGIQEDCKTVMLEISATATTRIAVSWDRLCRLVGIGHSSRTVVMELGGVFG